MIYEYFDGDLIKCGMKLKKNIYLAIYQYDFIIDHPERTKNSNQVDIRQCPKM
jgi:hypothetical protein